MDLSPLQFMLMLLLVVVPQLVLFLTHFFGFH